MAQEGAGKFAWGGDEVQWGGESLPRGIFKRYGAVPNFFLILYCLSHITQHIKNWQALFEILMSKYLFLRDLL